MTPPRPSADPLAVLASTLLSRAHADARTALDGADADADAIVSQARTSADGLLAEARAKGAADGAAIMAGERARAEREAREVLLRAERLARDEARRAARDAVSALRGDPLYPSLVDVLNSTVKRDLGPDVTVTGLARGGIVAEAPGRRIEYALDDLADDVMDRLGSDLDGLWSP